MKVLRMMKPLNATGRRDLGMKSAAFSKGAQKRRRTLRFSEKCRWRIDQKARGAPREQPSDRTRFTLSPAHHICCTSATRGGGIGPGSGRWARTRHWSWHGFQWTVPFQYLSHSDSHCARGKNSRRSVLGTTHPFRHLVHPWKSVVEFTF
jgi:hypothetical protein